MSNVCIQTVYCLLARDHMQGHAKKYKIKSITIISFFIQLLFFAINCIIGQALLDNN